jgi:hypothetical protein
MHGQGIIGARSAGMRQGSLSSDTTFTAPSGPLRWMIRPQAHDRLGTSTGNNRRLAHLNLLPRWTRQRVALLRWLSGSERGLADGPRRPDQRQAAS